MRSSPYDLIGQAAVAPARPRCGRPSRRAPTSAPTTDRPRTRPEPPGQSTPVAQPHTIQQDVDDVVALIAAAHLRGPFVMVAHSYGGLLLDLLARTHPDLVARMLLVDHASKYLPSLGTPAQNAAFARVAAAPPLPRVSSAVLSAGRFARRSSCGV